MDLGFFTGPFRRNSQKSLQWSGPCACLALQRSLDHVGPRMGEHKALAKTSRCLHQRYLSCLDFTSAIQIQVLEKQHTNHLEQTNADSLWGRKASHFPPCKSAG